MTAVQLKLVTPQGYRVLAPETVADYLSSHKDIAARLGGKPANWNVREVGDGNLNLVFIVEGTGSAVVVKQALPYLRLVGESWPLPLSRAYFEQLALREEARWAPRYVPALYAYDDMLALTVMEYLSPHIIMRKGLIRGITYPHAAVHLGEFLALTLFHTSDLYLSAAEKKEKIGFFLTNTALCKITEDLIFDQPYMETPNNRWTSPQLDEMAKQWRQDVPLKLAAQEMKWRFMNNAEAMIHGDLHTGSVMVTEQETRAIDPEFAFYGPMGFDIGAVIANFLLAYFSQAGHAAEPGERDEYAQWILQQIDVLWQTFTTHFTKLWHSEAMGDVYNPHIYKDAPDLQKAGLEARFATIWQDTVGFAGMKMIRRILGLAHVEDLESIADKDHRASCEKRALKLARALLVERKNFPTPRAMMDAAAQS